MKTRRILCLVLALALMFSVLALPAAAEEDAPRSYYHEEKLAYVLKAIGLFHGVSDVNLALDRYPDRAQSLVLMLRFMGLEPSVRVRHSAVRGHGHLPVGAAVCRLRLSPRPDERRVRYPL